MNDSPMFIIKDNRVDKKNFWVSAPVGYYRSKNGSIVKDNTPSPEWTNERKKAHEFKTHRSAARTANKTISGQIISA